MKKTIAVLFGGCSPEHEVSLQSAFSVLRAIDTKKYTAIPIGISKAGDWFHYCGKYQNIPTGNWSEDTSNLSPVVDSQNRTEHCLIEWVGSGSAKIPLDAAFPVLHGRNGEDGTVHGLFELADIPVVGCGTLSSALCMDKERANRLAAQAGVTVPKSVVLTSATRSDAERAAKELPFLLFVKPLRAGSSFGITKVSAGGELKQAVDLAFSYDDTVLMEEAIDGFEVGCAVMGTDKLTVGEPDEIELSGGFFDCTEKYTLKTSAIHVPARIDNATRGRVQETAKTIYRALGCTGFARVDLFLTPERTIVFNEVNTIPGFTSHSRYPAMMKAIGLSFEQVVAAVIEMAAGK